MPGAGHLVHMPAHIYIRLGKYHEAAERNAEAAHVDQKYLADRTLTGIYPAGYYTHNLHFLWASLAMEGRKDAAVKAARDLTGTITVEAARKEKWQQLYLPAQLFSYIRFGQWEALLREPSPPAGLPLLTGVWRLGRGLASAANGRLPGAEGEHSALAGLSKRLGRDRYPEQKTERSLLKIAERLLVAEIAVRRHQYAEAMKMFKDATIMEDALPYTEPPYWPLPIRHYLGAALLMAGEPAEAEAVYRKDLGKNQQNGWGLFGLAQSLRAQGKSSEAESVDEEFKKAWAYADVTLAASRF